MLRATLSRPWLQFGAMIALLLVMGGALGSMLMPAIDWHKVFRPAVFTAFSGQSPYAVKGFFYVPWTVIFLAPMAILPEPIGRGILAVVTLAAYAWITMRLGGKKWAVILVLLSPPVIHCVLNGNVDWLTALGFILPPQIGLFFLAIKPQMGLIVAFFFFIEAWRKNGWREILRVFWPVSLALLLSFALYGFWPYRMSEPIDYWWNASLWPMSIPVGLALLVAAIRKRRKEFAMAAAPCLTPYLLLHSWAGALLAVCASLPELVAAFAGLWILILIRGTLF